jgi:ATP-binding cassette subfamily C (CFTR/MRP) protein 1
MIFDDIFSALDRHTARQVFTNVLGSGGLLSTSSTTVILVTQLPLALSHADHIIVLDTNGTVAHQGKWEAMMEVSDHVQLLAEVAQRKLHTTSSSVADGVLLSPESPSEVKQPNYTPITEPDEHKIAGLRRKGDLGLYKVYANAAGNMFTLAVLLLISVSAFSSNIPSESIRTRFDDVCMQLMIR